MPLGNQLVRTGARSAAGFFSNQSKSFSTRIPNMNSSRAFNLMKDDLPAAKTRTEVLCGIVSGLQTAYEIPDDKMQTVGNSLLAKMAKEDLTDSSRIFLSHQVSPGGAQFDYKAVFNTTLDCFAENGIINETLASLVKYDNLSAPQPVEITHSFFDQAVKMSNEIFYEHAARYPESSSVGKWAEQRYGCYQVSEDWDWYYKELGSIKSGLGENLNFCESSSENIELLLNQHLNALNRAEPMKEYPNADRRRGYIVLNENVTGAKQLVREMLIHATALSLPQAERPTSFAGHVTVLLKESHDASLARDEESSEATTIQPSLAM